jgi:hypothetical protein
MTTALPAIEGRGSRVEGLTGAPTPLAHRLADFAQTHGQQSKTSPGSYCGWPLPLLREYLEFHLRARTLFYQLAPANPRVVLGLGIAWQMSQRTAHDRHRCREHVFAWEPSDPFGDVLFLADFVTVRRGVCFQLLREMFARHRGWDQLPCLTYRRGRLTSYTARHFQRIAHALPKPQEETLWLPSSYPKVAT